MHFIGKIAGQLNLVYYAMWAIFFYVAALERTLIFRVCFNFYQHVSKVFFSPYLIKLP